MSRLLGIAFMVIVTFPVLAQEPIKRVDLKTGLIFTVVDDKQVSFSRLVPNAALLLNQNEAAHPQSQGGQAFQWRGAIQIVAAGSYTFDATLQGKLNVKIGGQVVLTVEQNTPASKVAGQAVELKPGIWPVEITLERAGPAVRLELYWQGPRFRREPIPSLFFGHTKAMLPQDFTSQVQRDHGRFLLEELACVKCHQATAEDKIATGLAPRSGPNLSAIAERAYPGWLNAWLAKPQQLRPHTMMPEMFSEDATGQAERYAVVAYLASLGQPLQPSRRPLRNPNEVRQSILRGSKLYMTVGCATCHGDKLTAPPTQKPLGEDEEEPAPLVPEESVYGLGTATGPQAVYQLNHLGSKTTPEALAKWLKDPLATNPHGRMPNMQLNDEQARDLARFLCQLTDDAIATAMPPKPDSKPWELVPEDQQKPLQEAREQEAWQKAGAYQFQNKGCVNCHDVSQNNQAMPVKTTAPKLSALAKAPQAGCLSEQPNPKKVPVYKLQPEQAAALRAFLERGLSSSGLPAPLYTAHTVFKRFNCLNCHQRDSEGGINTWLADTMKSLESADNADDVQPPRLTAVGQKMRTSWMEDVLLKGGRARPWMNLRMPQYGSANIADLHKQLPSLDGTTTDDTIVKPNYTDEVVSTGRMLTGKQGHGCISCHDISGQRGGGTRGPDLATTNQRVRYDWYSRWMHQPQRLIPGTKMPSAFIDGKALLTTYYQGDGDKQIEALWAYFSLGPGLPLPAGMDPPPGLVVQVKDRPEIMRTFMPDDAGTKCIAVGFPGGTNLVYDSSQARLAYAWSGNFLEMSNVWAGRGGNPATVLGNKFYTPPPGHPWALSAGTAMPDFAKQNAKPEYGARLREGTTYNGPMAVRFTGYSLNDQGEPSFTYLFTPDNGKNKLSISEQPKPAQAAVANGLSREFEVQAPEGYSSWFRAALSADEPKQVDADGQFVAFTSPATAEKHRVAVQKAGGGLDVFTADAGRWHLNKVGDNWELLLQLGDGKAAFQDRVTCTVWSVPKNEPSLLKGLK